MSAIWQRPDFGDIHPDDPDSRSDYGIKTRSGRYRWGSGENPYQRLQKFHGKYTQLRKEGLTDAQIAKGWEMSSGQLRAKISNAKHDIRAEEIRRTKILKEKGMSNMAIAKKLGRPESTIRNYLKDDYAVKADKNREVADVLQKQVDDRGLIMLGKGVEHYISSDRLGKVSHERLNAAVDLLKEKGYEVISFETPQMGTQNDTKVVVLAPHGTTKKEVMNRRDEIEVPNVYYDGDTDTLRPVVKPVNVDSKRIQICYADDIRPDGSKGIDRDGMIELRRGVDDISLGKANYAQVRIAVDGTHYLKGMAVYSDDLPDGVDIRFNTNKTHNVPMMGDKDHSVLKPMKSGESGEVNPFGATIKREDELILCQTHYKDKDGNEHQSALNIVSEEGNWSDWRKALASQVWSKQSPKLAAKQLKMSQDAYDSEFDEIKELTNPTIKKKEFEEFADKCDRAAVDLKAAGLPRQAAHVILSVPDLKENEIYAPNYIDGETVCLIRFPHAGRFEIPTLKVNNSNEEARKTLGIHATDAVGINPKTAAKLSGADFDGDTVLVIPNNYANSDSRKLLTHPAIQELMDFEPKVSHKRDPNGTCPRMTKSQTQQEMGKITNLITDMQTKAALLMENPKSNPEESDRFMNDLVHAVKHSMVVIDAEKHDLDWQRSYEENGIAELKKRYQGGEDRGASTLISRASSEARVPYRQRQYNTNKMTKDEYERYLQGEKIFNYTGKQITKLNKDAKQAHELKDKGYSDDQIAEVMGISKRKAHNLTEKDIYSKSEATIKSTKMYEARDARELSSGTLMEEIAADYANHMKALGNAARREAMNVNEDIYNPSAAKQYAKEVEELRSQLTVAQSNAPLERRAQLLAGIRLRNWKRENPDLAEDKDQVRKKKGQFISTYRNAVGAGKHQIVITDKQWEAIQAGAVKKTMLREIVNNTKPDLLKQRAMPKEHPVMTPTRINMALSWANQGYQPAQIAEQLGVSIGTITNLIYEARKGNL